jgi:sigma-B regulation protein RsbU (phosphoserine phosphatase)
VIFIYSLFEVFGKDRFRQVIRTSAGLSAKGIVDAVIGAVKDFQQYRGQEDDITLVIVKVDSTQNKNGKSSDV